jgi:large subunit ribosomal protein L35
MKQKIKKSVSRRFKVTKTGKVLGRGAFARHLRTKKSKSQIRRLKSTKQITGKTAVKIKKLLGK